MNNNTFNTKYIFGISMVSALGGLLFGYDWVVIGGAKPFYEEFFHIANDPSMQGWAISSALIGCLFGAIASVLSDKYGRKKLLILAAALFFISAIGTGIANDFTIFIVYRIIGGVGIGLAASLSPVYIAEVAPASIRGKLVTLNQLTIVIGILLAQIVNLFIADKIPEGIPEEELGAFILDSWNGQTGWRYMFWAEGVPAFLFFVLIWLIPDSPRWLTKYDKIDKATAVLSKIGGIEYAKNTVEEIKESLSTSVGKVRVSDVTNSKVLPILIVGIALAILQQWCGINVIFLYAQEIFSSAGYGPEDLLFTVVLTGAVNLIFTLVSMAFVDKVGRRKLMLMGSVGLIIIYTVLGGLYYANIQGAYLLILVLAAIAVYAMTLAPVTWVILSEIFPNKVRGAGVAIATFALWIANAALAAFFPIINEKMGASGSFWLFAGICVFIYGFVKFRIKETKGKTLEEIEKEN